MIWRWFWREWRTPSLLVVWLSLTWRWPVCWHWDVPVIVLIKV